MEQALPVRCATFPNDLGQRLHVHLVNDAGTRWDHTKVVQALLSPFDETVALAVAAEVDVQVLLYRIRFGIVFDDNRVVDGEHRRNQRVHRTWIAAELSHHVTHTGKVSQCWQAGGVMEHQAVRLKRHFAIRALANGTREYWRQRFRSAASNVFQEDTNRIRKTLQLTWSKQFFQVDIDKFRLANLQAAHQVAGSIGHARITLGLIVFTVSSGFRHWL
ncbi:hypothetical protein D3C81_1030320 [compost metagenome]